MIFEKLDVSMIDEDMNEAIQEYLQGSKDTVEYKLSNPQELDWKAYRKIYEQLDKTNKLIYIRATEDSKVVGFAVIEVYPHSHYDFSVSAINSIFMMKEYRRHGNGKRLLNFCFTCAKEAGAKAFYLIAPHGSKLERTYQREFIQTDSLFIKEL